MTSSNPQITDDYSPLNALVQQALRRYGEYHPSTMDSETELLFVELANEVLDDIRTHPLHDGTVIQDYVHPTDARAVPDRLMKAGLLAKYAIQQGSPKQNMFMPFYVRQINRDLWHMLSGSGPIQLRVVDDGTHPRNFDGTTNTITGKPE